MDLFSKIRNFKTVFKIENIKSIKGSTKTLFVDLGYLGIISVFLFGFVSFLPLFCQEFSQGQIEKAISVLEKDKNLSFNGLVDGCKFVSPKKVMYESSDLSLIQKNSLESRVPPVLIASQVLGAMNGEVVFESQNQRDITEYIVEKGNTLSSIAVKFNIDLETLLSSNNLNKKSRIRQGQKLIILPISGVVHIVKKGDTLSQLIKTYKGVKEEIIDFNNLSSEGKIFIGDILIIPEGKMPLKRIASPQIPLANSYFIFPCQGTVTQGLHWYNAIDVANKCGTSIFAAAEGSVQRTGWTNRGGYYVRILHSNGVATYYGHLSKILVNSGQKVSQGEILGLMGRTGHATGCHIHFDVIGTKNPLSGHKVGSYLKF
ncbi:MAG: M23 family metallopeptidase [Patescibacteria group bacterium]|nr:M23 family metallopeptidase [Patescibacteria group bacterium]